MNSKTLNIFMAVFIIFSLVVSVGAEGNLSGDEGSISVEQIENANGETAEDFINQISEETVQTGERVESIPLEDVTSENEGADPGQEEVQTVLEEAPLSSQNNEESLEDDVVYIPLGEISEEISPSPSPEENETNQTTNILSNESQNQEEVSGQEEIEISPGQIQEGELNETNQTTLPDSNLEEDHTGVRGNTQEGTGSEDSGPVSLSSISSNEEKTIEYISLTEIFENAPENESNNKTEEEISEEKEIQLYSYYSEGKKVIEIETFKEVEISKEEFEESDFEKKVIISSEEHIEDPLRVYIDMQTEVVKSKIKIFWENENLEITELSEFSVKYYDENDNGLVDRVSWIVPHLSTQTFQIVIEPDFVENPNKDQIDIIPVSVPPSQVSNPIYFNFEIHYKNISNVFCVLEINDTLYNTKAIREFNISGDGENVGGEPFNLEDGTYNWEMKCIDVFDENITSSPHKSGNFNINEGFEIRNLQEIYFLDMVDGDILNPGVPIDAYSLHSSSKLITIKKNGAIHHTTTTTYLFLDESILNSSGNYEIIVEFQGENFVNATLNESFSVASSNISFVSGTYDTDEEVEVSFQIISPGEQVSFFGLDFGDGEMEYGSSPTSPVSGTFSKTYEDEGNYMVTLEAIILGETYTISKSGITIEYSGDNSRPDIDLDYPYHNSIVYDEEIKFRYTATDNIELKDCLFTLYNASGSNDIELYAQKDVPENGKEFEVHMVEFEDGEYVWEVNCSDNSSNWDDNFNFFEVILDNSSVSSTSSSFTDYDLKEEVENSLGEINAFLLEEEDFEADIKEVLEDLGISDDIDFYKKRLIQIDQYFKENYKYVDTEELREQKNEEYEEEFENIKNKIPKSIEIVDSLEYVKNSFEMNMEEVVEDYLKSTNTQTSKGFVKKLAQANLKLQQEISVEANIKKIEIEYGNETRELILVKKKIDLKNSGYDQLLEIIPKEIVEDADEVIFLVDNQIIKQDPIFEILKEDLTDYDEIVYYIEKDLKIKDFSKTETILFEESFTGKSSVTGFFAVETIFNADPVYFMIALLLVICLIILLVFVLRKKRVHKWKKEPNVVKCFELLRKANLYIKEKEVERARESYREIKRIYPVLPPKPKDYFYKEVKELSVKIDRRDIFGLVREYEEAKRGFNKEDCIRIYGKIKKVYERLPLKDRQKIYERISR